MSGFVHLHLHTEYSLLDGACVIKRLVKQLKEMGQTACAITDHGNMYGVIDFYKACKKEGVKPIIGCEVYVAPRGRTDKIHGMDNSPYHLVLLCKNQQGYQNLIRMVSLGYTEGFYNKPRIDRALLQQHHEGLICLSACLAGEIPRALTAGDYARAKDTALFYREIFGEDYYIELQDHGIEEQQRILPFLRRLSEELAIPMVCTNDCHYLKKEDAKTQGVLMCIQTNTVLGESNAMEFPTEEFYVKSEQEMSALFSAYSGAVENTVRIAEKCNLEFEFGVTKLPYFKIDGVSNNNAYFRKLCLRGLKKRYGDQPAKKLIDRLEYELSIIERMGYVDYFLIVWDFIRYAKEHDIPVGPGRGSGAGSLCAYCIGITGIDPMRYNLLFERFLNPERISMPDFDIDFCVEKRQKVIDYVVQKYGSNHVAQIITFGTMAAKGALRDVGRALGMPYQYVDSIAKMVPFSLNMTLDKALVISKELKTAYDTDEKAHELIETAKKLEGMPRHASTHAAGVVITRDPVSSYVPLQKNDEAIVTQYTMTTLEELGLLKMDFLGLRNLTVIDQCEKEICLKEPEFRIANIPLDDKQVFEMLSAGDTQGVFQFESAGMCRVLTQLKPDSLEDLIAVISLYRPGPMESIPKYIKNRHSPQSITYRHPMLKPILDVTYGCIVYQEQVMQICRQLAGYSFGRADLVRRAMAKKKTDVMEQEREIFIHGKKREDGTIECPGAIANGVDEKIANQIFNEMSSFAEYAFNKSHAAAYALIAYQTAYLKCHYKREYMAALLSSVLGNTNKVIEYIAECSAQRIRVLPPSINTSMLGFAVSGNNISFGLLAVKNLGRGVLENIISERETNGPYTSLDDFIERTHGMDVNKRAIESLIKSGAFDGFPHNRKEMIHSYEKIVDSVDSTARNNISGQLDLFGAQNMEQLKYVIPSEEDYTFKERISMEKETTGLFLSGHPLDGIRCSGSTIPITPIAQILDSADEAGGLREGDRVAILCVVQHRKAMTTRNKSSMAFLNVEDKTGSIEVIVFSKLYEMKPELFMPEAILLIHGKITVREDEAPKIICEQAAEASGGIMVGQMNTADAKLYIRFQSQSDPSIQKVCDILNNFPGNTPVIFYYQQEKMKTTHKKHGVSVVKDLINQLKTVTNEQNIVIR